MNKDENKYSNIGKFEKTILIRRLKRKNIDISNEDLEEVINVFNHTIDFCLENSVKRECYRYGFIITPRFLYENEDTTFLCIFRLLIKMQKHDLLNYLDYLLLINSHTYGGNRLDELYFYLTDILNTYYDNEGYKDFIFSFINNHEYLLQDILDNYLSDINESKYIPQKYKDIMNLYNEIFEKYYEEDYEDIDLDAYFQEYLNMSYYYFVINDLFNKEPNEIINYLQKVLFDIPNICDKLNIDGELEYKDRIKYIDTLYKERNKVKIIK